MNPDLPPRNKGGKRGKKNAIEQDHKNLLKAR
jgi:hypothetical protein